MTDMPSTATNESAKNPNGQSGSMAGCAVRPHDQPSQDLLNTKNVAVSPTSERGHHCYDSK